MKTITGKDLFRRFNNFDVDVVSGRVFKINLYDYNHFIKKNDINYLNRYLFQFGNYRITKMYIEDGSLNIQHLNQSYLKLETNLIIKDEVLMNIIQTL